MKRTKVGALTIIVITFFLGSIAGYSFSTILSDAEARKERKSPYGNVSEYVKERVNLNDSQIVIYDELVEERREKMSEIHSRFREQIGGQTDSLRNEIRAILTQDQLEEYERFLVEYTEYRKEHRKRK